MLYKVSNSEKLLSDYSDLLQIVKQRWVASDLKFLKMNKSKASRVLNDKQIDFLTLSEMASICGIDCNFKFIDR